MTGAAIALSVATLLAAAPPESGPDAGLAWMRASAEEYRLTVDPDGKPAEAELRAEPLLRWTNPTRRTGDSTLFLWTREGRPVAALCIYPFQGANDHEWTSLSERPLRASFPGGKDWAPAGPGVTFRPLDDAPAPAGSAVGRLVQMRTLARRFAASVYKPPKTDRLRLLPQPVYRYPDGTPGAADGAVFAFVQGTDPEVLLLLEARDDGLRPEWRFAPARMTSVFLECRDGDRVAWTVEPDWSKDPTHTYVTFPLRSPARQE